MPGEFWELMDTIAKVGFGAVTAGFVTLTITKLQHRQSIEQATVRRRLELVEEITAGLAEFANTVARYCLVTENILNAIYRTDSTIGDPPKIWVYERDNLGQTLKSGRALEKPEGLVYLISSDETLPKGMSLLQHLAGELMNEAGQNVQDIDPATLNKKLDKFRLQAASLMGELGRVYRQTDL